ncbi:hypothetical protein [Rhodopseudomonas palustris]|uniref:PNPLA domain-containing protein n=1 Tax=Rhodopseudomonas palustris (strain BisB18) TaxID=316056 RepID=Q20ZD7_RHOPB
MDQTTPNADDDERPWRDKFHAVFAKEIEAINSRREATRKLATPASGKTLDAVGLALSGGGIRSASVCLGVVQALNNQGLLSRIDYLSTVSGGGYLGSSLSATLTCHKDFVFGGSAAPLAGAAPATDISDTPAVGHLRNYSNYLIPRGFRDVLSAAAIVLRGLVANLSLVVPVLLLLAAVTAWSNPVRTSLGKSDFFGVDLSQFLTRNFGVTLVAGLTLLGLFLLWALARSSPWLARRLGWMDIVGGVLLVAFAAIAFFEFQPFVIEGMFQIADHNNGNPSGLVLGLFTSWVKTLAAAAAPVTALVVMFQRQIGAFLNSATAGSSLAAQASAIAIKLAVWVAGLALPLIIWVAYLYLSYWAIANDGKRTAEQVRCPPTAISATVNIQQQDGASTATLQGSLQPDDASRCAAAAPADSSSPQAWAHTPNWLIWLSKFMPGRVPEGHLMPALYVAVALLVFVLSWPLAPNANSLHRLYRDRLGKAFLFDPRHRRGARPSANEPSREQGRDFVNVSGMRLSTLSTAQAPYHLINAALNIQGSDFANRRGRNADFFVFSKYSTGSQATGYAPTDRLEAAAAELDLATAMAISGAAASANMGSKTIRPLTPTLALLNIRLGYWLTNPAFFAAAGSGTAAGADVKSSWTPTHRTTRYLWSELSGRLYENSDEIYLTDGGHIENLGIYELLRRQCRLIIAVDAEADSAMHFPSLVTLQRYARIDLGIRIYLPWAPIQAATLGCMAVNAGKLPPPPPSKEPHGPHVAIGIIDYGGGEKGTLVYIKSSLSGDENDYVRDYARRHAQFPHEATGDQFFSEEQFEVYRALGFHIAHGLLCGADDVSVASDGGDPVVTKFSDAGNATVAAVRAALGLSVEEEGEGAGSGV